MRYFVQRSTDGQVLYIRKAPNRKWEAKIDNVSGAHFLFEELGPGQSGWYEFAKAKAPTRLIEMKIGEVSLVADPPHGKKFVFPKG